MLQRQDTQLRSSDTYSDAVAAGSGMESPAGLSLEEDLNALRSQVKRIINNPTTPKWYDAILDSFGLRDIHDKMLAFRAPLYSGASFTLGSTLGGVLTGALKFSGNLVAVGASSTTNGGYLAADAGANFPTAGALGTVSTASITDPAGVLLNRTRIVIGSTNVPPVTVTGEEIFGLLQATNGLADGTAIGGAGSENLRLSFAYYAAATDTLTLTTLPADTYQFFPARQYNFYSLTRGALLSDVPPDTVNPSATPIRLPWREYQMTAGTPTTAGDPVNVTTGTFTTAGAQTNTSTYSTTALPTTGAQFRDDNRVKVWRNGQLQQKAATAGADVYWISATQMAWNLKLRSLDIIAWETPGSF